LEALRGLLAKSSGEPIPEGRVIYSFREADPKKVAIRREEAPHAR
jgi:hypothetical protein